MDTPKTSNAIRQVYLPMRYVKELERYRLQHRRIVPHGEFDFVFRDPHGNPFKPGDFSRRFTFQIRKHELPYLTVHGLRHTFATMVLANGKHTIYELSKVMGHSSITITSDIYGHLVSETGKKMAATMDSLLTLSK